MQLMWVHYYAIMVIQVIPRPANEQGVKNYMDNYVEECIMWEVLTVFLTNFKKLALLYEGLNAYLG